MLKKILANTYAVKNINKNICNIDMNKRHRDFSIDKNMDNPVKIRKVDKKQGNLPHNIRKMVWGHYIGYKYGIAKCWCCNEKEITQFEFECGHVQARSKGGADTITNLRPICGNCNRSMGNNNMVDFQKTHGLPKKDSYWDWTKRLMGF